MLTLLTLHRSKCIDATYICNLLQLSCPILCCNMAYDLYIKVPNRRKPDNTKEKGQHEPN